MNGKRLLNKKGMKLNVILLLLLLVMLICAVFAWLFTNKTQKPYTGVSNFNLTGDIYFMNSSGDRIEGGTHLKDGLLQINITNPEADNYLGNLRVDVKCKGYSPAYVRVRLLEQWIDEQTDTLQPVQYIPYTVDENKWYDNRQTDLYFYCQEMVSSLQTKEDNETVTLSLVKGVGEDFLKSIQESSASLSLTIVVDGVQPNRYQQFWNIDKLPWEAGGGE